MSKVIRIGRAHTSASYPDGVSLDEVWEAMRAAAETKDYKTAHQIAKDREVDWMCPVCVERHVAHGKKVPVPIRPEDVKLVAMTHDEVLIDIEPPKDHYDLPICNTCYDAWQLTFTSQRFLQEMIDADE